MVFPFSIFLFYVSVTDYINMEWRKIIQKCKISSFVYRSFMIMFVTKPLIHNIDTNLWPGITSITLRARQARSALRKKVKARKKVFRKQAWLSSLTSYRV